MSDISFRTFEKSVFPRTTADAPAEQIVFNGTIKDAHVLEALKTAYMAIVYAEARAPGRHAGPALPQIELALKNAYKSCYRSLSGTEEDNREVRKKRFDAFSAGVEQEAALLRQRSAA